MAGKFSVRLAELRKDKGISQKTAASKLGISQALLSHYEKGIRECSLDFLKKAAAFYNVTTDYLLGLNDNKTGLGISLDEKDNAQDSEYSLSTVYRAAFLLEKSIKNKEIEELVKNFLSVGLYRLICAAVNSGDVSPEWLSFPTDFSASMADMISAKLLRNLNSAKSAKQKPLSKEPECIKTVINIAEKNFVSVIDGLIETK